MGERKELKLAWCEKITRMALDKPYKLEVLKKADFDHIFSMATRLMKMRDDDAKREQEATQPRTPTRTRA